MAHLVQDIQRFQNMISRKIVNVKYPIKWELNIPIVSKVIKIHQENTKSNIETIKLTNYDKL